MATPTAKVLPGERLSLKDRLSRLTFAEACKSLGSNGGKLIQANANGWMLSVQDDVYLGDDLLRVRFPAVPGEPAAIVTITLMAQARGRLHVNCTRCKTACDHMGAVFSLVLEEKSSLGLAAPPAETDDGENLDNDDDLVARALSDRAQRARDERRFARPIQSGPGPITA